MAARDFTIFVKLAHSLSLRTLRARQALFMMLIMPVILLLIFGFSQDVRQGANKIVVYVAASGETADALEGMFRGVPGLDIRRSGSDEAQKKLTEGKAALVLEATAADPRAYTTSSWQEVAELVLRQAVGRFDLQVSERQQTSLFQFIFPGLLMLTLFQSALMTTGFTVLEARGRGTLRHLMLTPVSPHALLAAHMAVRVVMTMAVVFVVYAAAVLVFAVPTPVAPLETVLWMGLAMVLSIAIGFAIGGAARSQQVGHQVLTLANIMIMLFGSIFFDAGRIPALHLLSDILPFSYLSINVRHAILGTPSPIQPIVAIAVPAVWLIGATWAAARFFRKDMPQ